MAIMMVTLVVAVAWVITTMVRHSNAPHGSQPMPPAVGGTSAIAILEERYARGEMDDEEYRRRRSVLTSGGGEK